MKGKLRKPAVAGQFYADNRAELRAEIKDFFVACDKVAVEGNPRAVIVPHAGYVFSGRMAASAYACVPPHAQYDHIFLLGPSHQVFLDKISVGAGYNLYETPLGPVEVDMELCQQLIDSDEVFTFDEQAHEKEHCLEVQLPFLQVRLEHLPKIVPLVIATQDTEKLRRAAQALLPYFTPRNLFVISSDFSHYPVYSVANRIDGLTGEAIMTGKADNFLDAIRQMGHLDIEALGTCACGAAAIAILLMMTERQKNITIHHIGYCNSGDSPYGSKRQVVGYHSFVFAEKPHFSLTDEEKAELKKIARGAINEVFTGRNYHSQQLSPTLLQRCGAFVTLHKEGKLRGCIGHIGEDMPLYQVVKEMAHAAAFEDPRFLPLDEQEMEQIDLEISVLTPMQRIGSIDEFELGRHGIFIRKGHRTGTYLPQVAQEVSWTKEEFLSHCAQDKAGIGWDGWRDAELYTYEAIVF